MSRSESHIRIAVVGGPASGKSYLLFDLIHAFHILGYEPQRLPLSYPHRDFGAFFYENFHAGGMRGTQTYACRPQNHYGALLGHPDGSAVQVVFVNIPGEAFLDEPTMLKYFRLRDIIRANQKGWFWLVTYRSPAGQELQVVVPEKDFDIFKQGDREWNDYTVRYADEWSQITHLLREGHYTEPKSVSRRNVSGKYVLEHITEIFTDSLLLTIKHHFDEMECGFDSEAFEYKISRYFYFFTFSQLATDMVICDQLHTPSQATQLMVALEHYLDHLKDEAPRCYLAFRNVDSEMGNISPRQVHCGMSIELRNKAYIDFLAQLQSQFVEPPATEHLSPQTKEHIMRSIGGDDAHAFRALLNRQRVKSGIKTGNAPNAIFPAHTFFTATPVDCDMNIYERDPDNLTRFFHQHDGKLLSFVDETCRDMGKHGCFGSLQLLTDILMQNYVLPPNIKKAIPTELRYYFEQKS